MASMNRLLRPIDVEGIVVVFGHLVALLAAVPPVLRKLEHALTAFPLSQSRLHLLLIWHRFLA